MQYNKRTDTAPRRKAIQLGKEIDSIPKPELRVRSGYLLNQLSATRTRRDEKTFAGFLSNLPVSYTRQSSQNDRLEQHTRNSVREHQKGGINNETIVLSGYFGRNEKDNSLEFRPRGHKPLECSLPKFMDEPPTTPHDLAIAVGFIAIVETYSYSTKHLLLDWAEPAPPGDGAPLVPIYNHSTTTDSLMRSRYIGQILSDYRLGTRGDLPESYMRELSRSLQCIHGPTNDHQLNWALQEQNRVETWEMLAKISKVEHFPIQSYEPLSSSQGSARLPEKRLVKDARDAELYAAEIMRGLGFHDAEATPLGPDGGVDVRSDHAVAQVKMEARPTGSEALQRLSGIAKSEGVAGFFFSLSGYTRNALDWAHHTDVACFEFGFDGSVEPCSPEAERLFSGAGHNQDFLAEKTDLDIEQALDEIGVEFAEILSQMGYRNIHILGNIRQLGIVFIIVDRMLVAPSIAKDPVRAEECGSS